MLRRGGVGDLRFGNALETVDARDFLQQIGDADCADTDIQPVLGYGYVQHRAFLLHAEFKRSEDAHHFVRRNGDAKVAVDFGQRQFHYHRREWARILVGKFSCDAPASEFAHQLGRAAIGTRRDGGMNPATKAISGLR